MAITLDGTAGITTPDLTDTSLTSGRVVYAGTSGNLTGASGFVFDGNNLGIGAIPNTWGSSKAIQIGAAGAFSGQTGAKTAEITSNAYLNSGWKYLTSGDKATLYYQYDGAHTFNATTATGTAGNAITWDAGTTINPYGVGVGGGIPSSGIGITFPATQSASSNANTLDDYEEGTWTPSYGSGATSVTYGSVRDGHYRKIGSQVTIWFGIMTNSLTASASGLTITGLPFTASSGAGSNGTVNINLATRWVSGPPIVGSVSPSTTNIILYNSIAATGAGTDAVEVTTANMSTSGSNNRNIVFATATYFV